METRRNRASLAHGIQMKLGATSMRSGRPEFAIPVNLIPTAMSANKELFADTDSAPLSGAFPANHGPRAEVAEVIGQEILPLGDCGNRAAPPEALAASPRLPVAPGQAPSGAIPGSDAARASLEPGEQLFDCNSEDCAEVPVVVRVVPPRQGRPRKHEPFPFDSIAPAIVNNDGEIIGPSFFIPQLEEGVRRLAAAKKRHKNKKFISREVDAGLMIWRTI